MRAFHILGISLLSLCFSHLFASPDPLGFFPFKSSSASKKAAVSPQEYLERLIQGNNQYVSDAPKSPDRSSMRRMEVHQKQHPFAVIVGCSDSRVPPEIIFDQGIGDLFVVRVAGQVVGPVELDSIEYAIKYLGASLVFVLGHQSCGAVKAVLKGETADIEDVANLIRPAITSIPKNSLEEAIKANTRYVAEHLKNTPLIQKMKKEGKVDVVAGYYRLPDGKVEILP